MKRHVVRAVRAGIYHVLGAALLTPAAVVIGLPIMVELTPQRVLVWGAACLPGAVLLAMTPLIRRLEVIALSELLEVDVPKGADRLYLVVVTSLHLYGGATLSAGLVALSPELVRAVGLLRGAPGDSGMVILAAGALLTTMITAGYGQRWVASRLLRTEPSRMVDELGRRQTLAMELHDAVGHALSVVLVQAMAAQAALERPEPTLALESLDHLTATARHAQQDLDVLLSVLDDGVSAQIPTLEALGAELVLTVENATHGTPGGQGRGLTGMGLRARLAGGTCTWHENHGTWLVQARLPG